MTEWILTSSVLILLVIAVRGLFKNKMKAKYTYALWLVVLVRLLCPVNFGELSFNLLSLAEEGKVQMEEHLESQAAVEPEKVYYTQNGRVYVYVKGATEPAYQAEPVSGPDSEWKIIPSQETEAVLSGLEPVSQLPEPDWQKVLPAVWIAGMALLAFIIFNVNISFSTTLGILRRELPSYAKKGWGKTELSVYVADGINSSCLFGVVHPSIYLNKKGMNDREKTYCVEHEYSHYLQGDMIWSLCRVLCLILHWYNPLVWLAVVLSKKDAELACDERTIERLGEEERFSYGHTLVELAAGQSKAVQMLGMATLMAPDKKEVVDRVKAITTKKETKILTGLLVAILLVGIGCFVFTGEAKGEQENNNAVPTPTVAAAEDAAAVTEQEDIVENIAAEGLKQVYPEENLPLEGESIPDWLNVREGAGYNYDVLEIIPKGTKVTILETDEDWYRISYTLDGKENKGYVKAVYVEIPKAELSNLPEDGDENSAYSSFLEKVLEENSFPVEGATTPNKLNVRAGAGTDTLCLAVLPKNTLVTILSVEEDSYGNHWYQISVQRGSMPGYGYVSGYVLSDYVSSPGSSGLPEEGDESSAYAGLDYCPTCFEGAMNGGCDCGCKMFNVETPEYTGWVLHCEHDDRDAKIREDLQLSEEEWAAFRGEKKQFVEITLEEKVNYKKLSFTDHVALNRVTGEGWAVDLDGDGTPENLYINTDGVFVNGKSKNVFSNKQDFWLLNIDTTDSMYELLNSNGDLYIYDGKDFQQVKGIREVYFAEGGMDSPETYTRYFGTLNEFTRIDEHTITFEDHFFLTASFYADAQYTLDENHGLQIVPQVYEVTPHDAIKDVKYYYGSGTRSFKLYAEPALSADYVEAKELSDVQLLKSDCIEWAYIETESGLAGWLYFGGTAAQEYFFTIE